jgi:hypothetical protein
MQNLPSNNETNIIRNIFDISTNFLNEQVKVFDPEETARAMRNAPGLGKDIYGKFRPTADVRQQILMTPTTQVPQPRRTGTDIVKAAEQAATKNTEGAIVKADTKLAVSKAIPTAVTKGAAAAKPGLLTKFAKGIALPIAAEVGTDLALQAAGMKGGVGQAETGRGMQPAESEGALDYARNAVSTLAGGVATLNPTGVASALPFVGWNAGRAIAKQAGLDTEDRGILELGAETLGTSGSQHGRSQQLEKEQAAGEAARQARASDPEFLKKQAADKAARQAGNKEEKTAAPAKEFALPASTLKPTENPLAGAANAKSAPAKSAAPIQTPAPATTRTPIMPGSSKEVIKTTTSNPTADIMKTIQSILTAPSAAPAKPATSGKLPEQPMDRAVNQFKNSQEEQKAQPAKGAYESGKEVPEAEWKARQAKQQAAWDAKKAQAAATASESQGLQKTIEAQKARLAELDKSNTAKLAGLQAQAAASKKAAEEADPVAAAAKRMINRNAGRPEGEDLPVGMEERLKNRPVTGGMNPISEAYYRRLANLFEETRVTDTPMSGVNPAAYGYFPKGYRKASLVAKRFAQEPMANWAADSTVEAPDLEPESKERPHIDTVVAPYISTLIAAADKVKIGLSHGEAFNPSSRDHQALLKTSKDPAVLKASQAIGQIRKDYGVED